MPFLRIRKTSAVNPFLTGITQRGIPAAQVELELRFNRLKKKSINRDTADFRRLKGKNFERDLEF